MPVEVFLPKATDFMEEGVIQQWLVSEGDYVEEGQPLLEVETDKAVVDLGSPAAGYVKGIRPGVGPGTTVPVGETIAYIVASLDESVVPLERFEPTA